MHLVCRIVGWDCLNLSLHRNYHIQMMSLPVFTVGYSSASGVDKAVGTASHVQDTLDWHLWVLVNKILIMIPF
jgi:hypothetical protein